MKFFIKRSITHKSRLNWRIDAMSADYKFLQSHRDSSHNLNFVLLLLLHWMISWIRAKYITHVDLKYIYVSNIHPQFSVSQPSLTTILSQPFNLGTQKCSFSSLRAPRSMPMMLKEVKKSTLESKSERRKMIAYITASFFIEFTTKFRGA